MRTDDRETFRMQHPLAPGDRLGGRTIDRPSQPNGVKDGPNAPDLDPQPDQAELGHRLGQGGDDASHEALHEICECKTFPSWIFLITKARPWFQPPEKSRAPVMS